MPYSLEDKHIIKHDHTKYKWGSQKILNQLGNGKKWSRGGIQKLIEKIDKTGSIVRKKGSGRPRSIDNIIGSFRKRIKACIAAEERRFEYNGLQYIIDYIVVYLTQLLTNLILKHV